MPATASEAASDARASADRNTVVRAAAPADASSLGRARPRRRRRPRWTLRLRLTLLYGGLFLTTGAVLLAITYGLVANSIAKPVSLQANRQLLLARSRALPALPFPTLAKGESLFYSVSSAKPGAAVQMRLGRQVKTLSGAALTRVTAAQEAEIKQVAARASEQIAHQRSTALDALLTKSGVALGIMAIVSIGLGWLMAGRALRPVRTMGLRARGISERNLHERLALDGPDDELKELGDTFDGLLARLETAFESQRRFVANASHELRTPITVERTLVEVALADPEADVESLRGTCERVLVAGEQQERLIEALLTLARSQRGLERREQLDLAAITAEVLHGVSPNGVELRSSLGRARTTGDPALVERLVANLVQNAVCHNVESGWVRAWTGIRDGMPAIRVTNPGEVIEPDQVPGLIEPFRRLNGDRSGHRRGLGLGLSIVDAIAVAHGAVLDARARDGGGLDVEVRFPAACSGGGPESAAAARSVP